MRSSVYLQTESHSILVDSGPDLRQQALKHNLKQVDAVLYTHSHLDHITGFDELRAFCWRRDEPLPMYSSQACLDQLAHMFAWAFSPKNIYKGYIKPDPRPITKPFALGKTTITPIPVEHGSVETLGYRFDEEAGSKIAYIPDAKVIPNSNLDLLHGLDHLIIDALRPTPHNTHLSIPESVEIALALNPKQTWLTHISHETDYKLEQAKLPPNITFAYDGLTIS
ncbi:MBL fold metallo-hydrolase [Rubritalea marina]|uniref:MBL fold metallo-hydrolase n=1 Tax=Rubritalea marina TaxID=361055 RepID=UPI0003651068|nr:MBL fold metallo-hydrolase [Rubritalea marina]